jgi:hypothetical protein
MTLSLLALLLAAPAAANPAAMTATLEAIQSQAAVDPAALANREEASAKAGKSFDHGFTIQTLTPVEYVPLTGEPRKSAPPRIEEKPKDAKPADGTDTDYYFEGKQPLNGITIYTPVKGQGSTAGGNSPTDKYGSYGKYAIGGGLALLAAGAALGGTPLVALALVGGLLIGAGAVLAYLFGKKK